MIGAAYNDNTNRHIMQKMVEIFHYIYRSIPYQRDIVKTLEQDRFVRSVMDSKGTDYGMYSRYKAELHLDGRQIALDYMETIDTEELIKVLLIEENKSVKFSLKDYAVDTHYKGQKFSAAVSVFRGIEIKYPFTSHQLASF